MSDLVPVPVPVPLPVTPRQRQLLYLASVGMENREIADELGLTLNTVKYQLHRTYRRLGARNRAHAVRLALEIGLLGVPGEDAHVSHDLARRLGRTAGRQVGLPVDLVDTGEL